MRWFFSRLAAARGPDGGAARFAVLLGFGLFFAAGCGSGGEDGDPSAPSCEGSAPGVEICNGVDDDCNGKIDDGASDAQSWYRDADGDSYGDIAQLVKACSPPAGYVDNPDDCKDGEAAIHPGNGGCGRSSSFALVSGGSTMESASYSATLALGESPGGTPSASVSAHYRLQGGLVGATQGP